MEFPYRLTRLPNGVRIASVEMPWMRSVSIGVWAGVGGRHESAEQSGISHFIEHLLFKGTKKRSAKRITESVEGLGGYLNAFTTEDHTCYYAKAAAPHLPELCDVLGDMYLESQFAPAEIEREREVIREEILMYRDHPAQHAQELLTATMWPGHPLGRPLTGTVETIGRLRAAGFRGLSQAPLHGQHHHHHRRRAGLPRARGGVAHARFRPVAAAGARRASCARRPKDGAGAGFALYPGNRADASGDGLPCLRADRRTALRAQAALGHPRRKHELAALPEAARTPRLLLQRADQHGDAGGHRRDPRLCGSGRGKSRARRADDSTRTGEHLPESARAASN